MTKCFALLLCLLALPVAAQEDIRVGVELQPYQPYSDVENGEYRGYARDLLDAFAAEYGYRFVYMPLPVRRRRCSSTHSGPAGTTISR